MSLTNFNDFIASLESLSIDHVADTLTAPERVVLDGVYGKVKAFLTDVNLIPAESIGNLEEFALPMRSFNRNTTLADISGERILELCRECNIPEQYLRSAVESVSLCIHNYSNGYNASVHMSSDAPSSSRDNFEVRGFDTLFSKGALNSLISTTAAAVESFGQDIANTISDAKVAMTVAILRYHRSALHRLIPNIPTDSNMVSYKVDNMEVYDLTKSRSDSAAVRYEDKHRIPFVELYNDPSPANTALKPIILRVANDGTPAKLLAENVVKIGVGVNMFDYSIDAGQIGYQHIDYTDLVGDNVRIKTLYISVTNGTVTEVVPVVVTDTSGARMLMSANNLDSGDRVCSLKDITSIDNTAKIVAGSVSTLLSGLSVDGAVKLTFSAAGSINLKTSDAIVHGNVGSQIVTKSGNPVIGADQTLFDSLAITLVGYEIDAQFSEENIRKTTKAMRIMTKQVGYEIPGSANYIVQYSLTQTRPESVIDGLTKLMSIGIDDRGLKLVMDTLKNVRDRITAEKALSADNYVNKVGNDFVAGQRVKPYVWMDTMVLDATKLKNLRSADKWGDIRALAEEYLLNVFSRIYRESYYTQEIGQGEKPVFSVLTSIPIKDSLLSVPHYHNHLADTAADKVADGVVEFRRTLPDGTIMNVITTTFNYMDDKILIVPVRPNKPQSVLNFAHNRERGTYLTQATPTVDNAIFNSLIGNAREIVIPTNPVGALITVSGLHEIFDGFGALG